MAVAVAKAQELVGDAVERSRGLAASELKGEKKSNLAVHGRAGEAEVRVDEDQPVPARVTRDGDRLTVSVDGVTTTYAVVHAGGTVWLATDGHVAALREHERLASSAGAAAGDGAVPGAKTG